jgi:hypothetical protein
LKVWQSGDMADAQGLEGYLRYSFEILTDPAEQPSQDLCVAAMNSFQDRCQKKMMVDVRYSLLFPKRLANRA